MPTSLIEKIFFFVLLAIVIILMIAIFYPFLTVLILAAAFAVVLNPVYLWISKHITKGTSWLASFITTLLFVAVVCIPLFFIGTAVLDQVQNIYHTFITNGSSKSFELVNASVNQLLPKGLPIDVGAKITDLISLVSMNLNNFFASTMKTIVLFMLMVLAIFYLLKDGEKWKRTFTLLCPLSEENINEIFTKLGASINQIIKGTFLIAIIQGVLCGIGFAIFGVPNPVLWGVAAGIASFVPTVGTSLIFIPAILFLFGTGMHNHAIALTIWSVALVGMIDNILAPFIISQNTEMPSLFILFSILGGVSLMGPVGILIGPLALSLLYSLIAIYRKESKI